MHRPISLLGLEKLGALESLALHGAIADLETVASLPKLASLALRFMPSIEGLPPLSALPGLDSIIVYNVDEQASKSMRQQLKDRAKVRPWSGHASVSQPRKPEWFASVYGRPFSSWPGRRAKVANAAFDEAQATLAKARTAKSIEAAIVAFARTFNTMKGIETTEREDLADAVVQLIEGARAAVTEEMALGWFDGARDY